MAQVVFLDETGFEASTYGAPDDVARKNYDAAVARFKKKENHEGHFGVVLKVTGEDGKVKEVARYPAKKTDD